MPFQRLKKIAVAGLLTPLFLGCAEQAVDSAPSAPADVQSSYAALFDAASVIGTPQVVDCKLSGGAVSSCLSITVHTAPQSIAIGPWCPRHISDGPDVSGIWLDDGKVYDADGTFIQNMSAFYADDAWQMFDLKTGKINVTDTQVSCEAAARPDVDPQYQNHCVECQIDYMPEGASQTYVLPITPVPADNFKPCRPFGCGLGV